MNGQSWAGLDVGTRRTSVCVTDDFGAIIDEAEVETTPHAIAKILRQHPSIVAASMETGSSPHLVRKLRSAGFPIIVFDAFKASRYLAIRRNKTDANDARGLAEIGRLGRTAVSEVMVRNLDCQAIRSKLKLRRGLSDQRRATESLIRAVLDLHGRRLPRTHCAEGLDRETRRLAVEIAVTESIDVSPEIEPLLELSAMIRRHGNRLELELRRTARRMPECRRMMTIPGVGPICSLSFFSAIENPFRFSRIADIGAYLGLAPLVRETGGRAGRARISKAGDPMTRANLYVAAQVLMSNGKRDCALLEWAESKKKQIGSKRARVALARKLAITMAAIWKSGGVFVDFPTKTANNELPGTPPIT